MAGYQNKKIQTKHHEILRRAHLGQHNTTIAAELGLHPVTVGLILRSSLAKAELLRMRNSDLEKVTNTPARVKYGPELAEAAEKSLKYHLRILNDEVVVDEKIKANVAKQHVEQGIYRTEVLDNETVSFRDIIRGLSKMEQALSSPHNNNVINITPQQQ